VLSGACGTRSFPKVSTPTPAVPIAITNAASPHSDAQGQQAVPFALPRMGSGGYAFAAGNASPAASVPNGMARVGPETTGFYQTLDFLHYDGYWAGAGLIRTQRDSVQLACG
jgi:putative alpha-1,2-mannosidase